MKITLKINNITSILYLPIGTILLEVIRVFYYTYGIPINRCEFFSGGKKITLDSEIKPEMEIIAVYKW